MQLFELCIRKATVRGKTKQHQKCFFSHCLRLRPPSSRVPGYFTRRNCVQNDENDDDDDDGLHPVLSPLPGAGQSVTSKSPWTPLSSTVFFGTGASTSAATPTPPAARARVFRASNLGAPFRTRARLEGPEVPTTTRASPSHPPPRFRLALFTTTRRTRQDIRSSCTVRCCTYLEPFTHFFPHAGFGPLRVVVLVSGACGHREHRDRLRGGRAGRIRRAYSGGILRAGWLVC